MLTMEWYHVWWPEKPEFNPLLCFLFLLNEFTFSSSFFTLQTISSFLVCFPHNLLDKNHLTMYHYHLTSIIIIICFSRFQFISLNLYYLPTFFHPLFALSSTATRWRGKVCKLKPINKFTTFSVSTLILFWFYAFSFQSFFALILFHLATEIGEKCLFN